MKVIEYFETDNQEYWLSKIKECDWVAGKFLVELIQKNEVIKLLGQNTKVLLLINELELISFCTLSDIDDIETTDLTPWIGFVYTFPKYRGNRYMGNLFNYAEQLAKSNGFSNIYISTDQEGIYEKYGFTFLGFMKDRCNVDSRLYTKVL
jgi:predicted acetyltransferase